MSQKQNLVKLSEEQLNELEAYLHGSQMSIEEGLAGQELTIDQLEASSIDDIYATVFKCSWCGYWCDTDEDCGDLCCYQCAQEGKEENEEEEFFIDNEDNSLDDGDDA